MELAFAKRPSYNQKGRCLKVLSNYYEFRYTEPHREQVFKYNVQFEPSIPDNSQKIRRKVLYSVQSDLKEALGFFIYLGTCLYSLENCPEEQDFETTYDDQKYKITVQWVQGIERTDPDMLVFYKVFFNSLLKKLRLKPIGRNYYDPSKKLSLTQKDIEIWPGFSSSL